DLIKDLGELNVPFVDGHVPDVGCAHHVGEGEQWIVAVGERFALVHVDCGHARAAGLERGDEGAGFDESHAAGVHEECGRFHRVEVGAGHDSTRRVDQPEVQRHEVT